jgi:uncharacterized membrane protein
MAIKNPQNQTTDEIVSSLQTNDSHQYTESAHAEIFRRLTETIKDFNQKAERLEKVMLFLATAQVILALAQIWLAVG